MRIPLFRPALVLLSLSYAGSAFALFDVQVLAGKRWYESGSGDDAAKFQATEFDLAAHIDPIPLVPVSFGVIANVINPKKEDLGATEAKGFQAGLDFQGWLPFVPVVTPYARISLPLFGSWVTESKDEESGVKVAATSKVTGYRLAVGAKYDLLPVLKLLFEAGMGMEKIETTEVKVAGTKDDSLKGDKEDLKSNAIMLGVEMGL